ncbi:MAG: glycosyltransferase family 1 protein [Candidatus Pacebacteria bacterium]|nr:glycosyltransferase family 1 protein [Candidatus Paceibacterota bacterium]
MIIGIDIRMLAKGGKTGVEEYTCNLLENMLSLDKSICFKLFYNGFKKQGIDYNWTQLSNVEVVNLKVPNKALDASLRFFDFPKMEKLIGKIDKFFSPHIFLSSVGPESEKIVTFHDLSFEKYPEFYSKQKNFWHFSMDPKRQAQRADKIIAVSESTKQDLTECYGIDPQKISVIYSGLNPEATKDISEKQKEEIKTKYRLPENFILYLGTIEPRKNIKSLISAFDESKRSGFLKNSDMKLIIAGSKGWLYKEILGMPEKLKSQKDIIFTGFVEEKDKSALYNLARLFVYPSFYEGFGFPPLEAMAQGTPVITSNISSIPEAVANAAITINPYNTDELLNAIESVLQDEKLSSELINLGKKRIEKFNWEKCGRETLDYIID